MTIITHMFVILCTVVVMWWTLTVECLHLICAFYCYFWHGKYIVVTRSELCNVTQLMQITKNVCIFQTVSIMQLYLCIIYGLRMLFKYTN